MDVSRRAVAARRARKNFYAIEDFVNNVTSPMFSTTGSGTGNGGATAAVFDASGIGVSAFSTGTTTTGRFGVTSNNTTVMYFATTAVWEFETRVYIPVLSNGTDTFTVFAGFMDSNNADSADGVYFSYSSGLNSGKFEVITANNGTRTRTDSGVTAAATTWYTLKAVVLSVGGTLTAQFFINGAQVGGNITTNIPTTAARATGYGTHIVKSAGTTNVILNIDYVEVLATFSAGR